MHQTTLICPCHIPIYGDTLPPSEICFPSLRPSRYIGIRLRSQGGILVVLQATEVTPNNFVDQPPEIPIEAVFLLIPGSVLLHDWSISDDATWLGGAGCPAADEP